MDGGTLILSDLHMGAVRGGVRQASQLRPLWKHASRVIINGDVAEIHHPNQRIKAARHVLELNQLAEDDGVELTMLSGNHDAYLVDQRHLMLADQQILVMHGDAVHPAISPWSRDATKMKRTFEAALGRLGVWRRSDLAARLEAAQFTSHKQWVNFDPSHDCHYRSILTRPWAIFKLWQHWRVAPRLTAEFAARFVPRARFVIVGHTHRAGIWDVGPRTIINTGGYGWPATPLAVWIRDREIRVLRIIADRREPFRFDPQPRGVYWLKCPEPTAPTALDQAPQPLATSA